MFGTCTPGELYASFALSLVFGLIFGFVVRAVRPFSKQEFEFGITFAEASLAGFLGSAFTAVVGCLYEL